MLLRPLLALTSAALLAAAPVPAAATERSAPAQAPRKAPTATAPRAGATAAPTAPLRLRIVGGLANVHQYTRHEAPFWTQRLAQLSGGRVTGDIVPYDQAGIRGADMLRLLELGTVSFGTALLTSAQSSDPELGALDLAGMNPDMATLRRSVTAFRPALERILRERHGVELLAIYTYPAQVLFCGRPFASLADLNGRRVRVSGVGQADFVRALGALPVATEFAAIVREVQAGNVECAVTGAMSGHTIGLDAVTSHLSTRAFTWGLSVFVAHRGAWAALPADVRTLLRTELPKLEEAIWNESERETSEGVACATGAPTCPEARRGRMIEVRGDASDTARMRALFAETVLPAWIGRCGAPCVQLWNQQLAGVIGVEAVPPR